MDERGLLFLNGLRAPWLDAIADPLSSYGYFVLPALALFALLSRPRATAARSMLDSWLAWFLASFLSDTVIKPIVHRPRPTADAHVRELIEVLGRAPPATSFAFPSGTAAAVFGSAVFIWLRWGWRRLWPTGGGRSRRSESDSMARLDAAGVPASRPHRVC